MTRGVAMVLLGLLTGPAMAQPPKVTTLMTKDIPESPGRELMMLLVEHVPGGSSPAHRTMPRRWCTSWRGPP